MQSAEPSMLDYRDQSSFASVFAPALLDPERPAPDAVAGPNGKAVEKRYNVYRNNVTVSLIEALGAVFPATKRITGADFFRAMARFHVRATPPTSPLLFEYGRDFPGFIERYEYAKPLPWLSDVARLERAWLDAYHAADAEPLSPEALGSIGIHRLGETVFVAHPAARIVRSKFSALSIFAGNRGDCPSGNVGDTGPEDALVTRPYLEVAVRRLPPGGAVFLTRLIAGAPFGEAAASALADSSDFDLSANIIGMISAGAFTSLDEGRPSHGA